MAVYREEIQYFSKSNIFVAKNRQNEIIGTIRIMEWNRNDELPITKIFGIKELDDISPVATLTFGMSVDLPYVPI